MTVRATLRRYHIWLGWIVGLPILIWTISGLVMVMKPIEEVRGTELIAATKPVAMKGRLVVPNLSGLPVASLKLEQRHDGPRWIIALEDGHTRLADPHSGALLPELGAADATAEVMSRYKGSAKVVSTTRTDPAKPPIELRRPIATWKVAMSDDTHFFVDTNSGEIVARRTGWWRIYDFFWGLHIMDLQGREDSNNPWVVTLSALSILMAAMAIGLLLMTLGKKSPSNANRPNR